MDTDGCPPVKKRRMQKFLPEYHKRWPVLSPSDMGPHYAKCRVCGSSFSISHGGANDCAKHVNGTMHQKYAKSKLGQSSIEKFCIKGNDNEHETTNAELLWTNFITEHNLPVSVSDHFGPLVRNMFPDSKIASKFQCGHTKTAALIHEIMTGRSFFNKLCLVGFERQKFRERSSSLSKCSSNQGWGILKGGSRGWRVCNCSHVTSRHVTPRHTPPHHVTPHHTTPRHTTPHHTTPTTTTTPTPHHTYWPWNTLLCYVMSCYVMQSCDISVSVELSVHFYSET